jgi:nickel-dependent lactate racemase
MKVNLAYGQGHLPVELPKDRTTVIAPAHTAGVKDERAAVIHALETPIGSKPLKQIIKSGDKICISFTDITRTGSSPGCCNTWPMCRVRTSHC